MEAVFWLNGEWSWKSGVTSHRCHCLSPSGFKDDAQESEVQGRNIEVCLTH